MTTPAKKKPYYTIQFRFGERWVDMSCYHTPAGGVYGRALRFADRLAASDYRRDRVPTNEHVRIAEHA
jgi:hypothetical protein